MPRRASGTRKPSLIKGVRGLLVLMLTGFAGMTMLSIPSIGRRSDQGTTPSGAVPAEVPKTDKRPRALAPGLCKSNRSDDHFLFKIWRVLENEPQLRLRVAGPYTDETNGPPEALVTNQQMFLNAAGQWTTSIKSKAEDGLKISATLDFTHDIVPLLPETDRSWKFATCALVGNSGGILTKDY
eukprot:8591622-Pyramimonas_sp.AAC.1